MTGLVKDVEDNISQETPLFTTHTTGDEGTKGQDSNLTTAYHFATVVIDYGDTETNETNIKLIC